MRVGSIEGRKVAAKNAGGFTLVELLVVMSIIAVLAAIIFPIVNKVKERTYITVCLSNMKQVGVGLQLYTNQYDDRFPAAAPWGSPDYWKQGIDKTGVAPQKTIQTILNSYVRSGMTIDSKGRYEKQGVFICPSDTGLPAGEDFKKYDYTGHTNYYNGVPVSQPIWKYAGCSYEYFNSNQPDPNNPREKVKWTGVSPFVVTSAGGAGRAMGAPLSAVMHLNKKAILCDVWYWHMGDQIPGPKVGYRNTLFADGHAMRIRGVDSYMCRGGEVLKAWHGPDYQEVEAKASSAN